MAHDEFMHWIEEKLNKKMMWPPVQVGWKNGRELYRIIFEDESSGDYHIDFESEDIEEA